MDQGVPLVGADTRVMLTVVASHLAKAALLALMYGMNLTLAAVRSRVGCCRPLALGSAGLVLGSLGISFCCGPLVGLIGPRTRLYGDTALGISP